MLLTLKQARECALRVDDATVGPLCDLFLDSSNWLVSHLVFSTGEETGRDRIVVPRNALGAMVWRHDSLYLAVTTRQLRAAPRLDGGMPLRSAEELDLQRYYQNLLGNGYSGLNSETAHAEGRSEGRLQSAFQAVDYQVDSVTGKTGVVDDLLVDPAEWCIRFLVVNTRESFPRDKVIIPPVWVSDIDAKREVVSVETTADAIKSCPLFKGSVVTSGLFRDRVAATPMVRSTNAQLF